MISQRQAVAADDEKYAFHERKGALHEKSKIVKLLSILLCVVVMIPAFSVSAGNDSASEAQAIELDDGEKKESER